jgi:NAD(P) transhydrogenase subunit alpha
VNGKIAVSQKPLSYAPQPVQSWAGEGLAPNQRIVFPRLVGRGVVQARHCEHSRTFAPWGGLMDFISILSIFVLACFVGYYVVWSVTPALHTPLMSVTNAISSVIVVGALIAAAAAGSSSSKWLGLVAVALASVNIFGGFAVTARMLSMYKKRERPADKVTNA